MNEAFDREMAERLAPSKPTGADAGAECAPGEPAKSPPTCPPLEVDAITPDGGPAEPPPVYDPEKYARMAKPYGSDAEAQEALAEFTEAVAQLREELRIAEVVIVAAAYGPPRGPDTSRGVPYVITATHGDSTFTPDLIAVLWSRFVEPVLKRARRLESLVRGGKPGGGK